MSVLIGDQLKSADTDFEKWQCGAGHQTAGLLLAWFDRTRRDLPWRINKDPYRILLSEIMLQQTQVQTVIPYFAAFLRQWPTLADLAAAEEEMVLKSWEGLGYYSRARNLLAAARIIRDQHDSQVPVGEKQLLALPGIGEYTAAAIRSIAFGQTVAAVDGNIVRVFARLTATPWNPADLPQRREVRALAESILPPERAGDWNEALMDLGATVCLPRQPICADCPLADLCLARAGDNISQFPAKPAKKDRPVENRILLVLTCGDRIHVAKRPAKGLLANLYEFDWLQTDEAAENAIAQLYPAAKTKPLGRLVHDFTHRRWVIDGYWLALPAQIADSSWVSAAELAALPLPTALTGYRDKIISELAST